MAAAYAPNKDIYSISEAKENLRKYMKDDGEDQDWKNRAVGCGEEILRLIEEISGTRGLLELEKAIGGSNSETECVVITLSHTVYWPHVASYRLWRWPDLPGLINPIDMHNYEQDPSNHHLSSAHRQGQSICVNPYHYYYDTMNTHSTPKKRLLRYKKTGWNQLWLDHSTDCLNTVFKLKELEESRGLSYLENVISAESTGTACILIKPSDTRLYVKAEKYLPHVALYKLWRCPDLGNSAAGIQPILKYETLLDIFHVKNGRTKPASICINPFHYEETPEAATVKCLKDYVKKSGSEDPEQNTNDYFDKFVSLLDENIMKALVDAIEIDDTKPTECIIFKPTKQVGTFDLNRLKRHYWPHIVSCRLWRWHGLKNNHDGIEPIAEYEKSQYHHPKTKAQSSIGHPEFELCINPFHYQNKWTPLSASVDQ